MNTTPNDGGPAFPAVYCDASRAYEGMSLRDWFAGQALMGLTGDLAWEVCFDTNPKTDRPEAYLPLVARTAYAAADAMLAQRSQNQPPPSP